MIYSLVKMPMKEVMDSVVVGSIENSRKRSDSRFTLDFISS